MSEINGKWVCRAVYQPTMAVYWASANGGWDMDMQHCRLFSKGGATGRVNAMNNNHNWKAEKLPVAIKVFDEPK